MSKTIRVGTNQPNELFGSEPFGINVLLTVCQSMRFSQKSSWRHSHVGNTGSNPVGTTKYFNILWDFKKKRRLKSGALVGLFLENRPWKSRAKIRQFIWIPSNPVVHLNGNPVLISITHCSSILKYLHLQSSRLRWCQELMISNGKRVQQTS